MKHWSYLYEFIKKTNIFSLLSNSVYVQFNIQQFSLCSIEQGSTIQGTISDEIMRSNRTIMGEGEWYEIFNFKLRFNFKQFRTTKNRFHVITGENTVVRKVTTTAPCNYYGFKEFKTILRGLAHPMYSVGMVY